MEMYEDAPVPYVISTWFDPSSPAIASPTTAFIAEATSAANVKVDEKLTVIGTPSSKLMYNLSDELIENVLADPTTCAGLGEK
jgi:hypothetical protein